MKRYLWLAVVMAFCGCLGASDMPQPDMKLKVRWQETKDKSGKRIVTVFIKNDGMVDLKDVPAEIVLKGQAENERQKESVKLTIPRNQEKSLNVSIRSPSEFLASIEGKSGGFSTMAQREAVGKPIAKLALVELAIGQQVFASR